MEIHNSYAEPWKVTLENTGLATMTGGRIKRTQKYIGDETFLLTYGDGVADININKLIAFHKAHGKLATITAVQPEGRFGSLDIGLDNQVKCFIEKPKGEQGWINGGFFVCEPGVFDYIENDTDSVFEQAPLQKLARDSQLVSYKHDGFWKCMDTKRDHDYLNAVWQKQDAPWKVW